MVARLFSDPTYFPVEFRTWLKNYIESAGINVTASQIRGGTRTRTGLPPGLFVTCGSVGSVPPDALQCDGRAVSRSVYALLFQKIGTTWGAGDGTTTFNIPDIRDRALYMAGSTIGVGGTDGQVYGVRKGPVHHHGTHGHVLTDNGHRHPQNGYGGATTTGGPGPEGAADTTPEGNSDYAFTGITLGDAQVGTSGGLQDTSNWAGVIYAITTGQTA